MGAFFSLMSSTFAYEDPTSRTWQNATMNTTQKTAVIFKDMGKGMWRGGKGFGTVGALYAGSECVIEGVSLFPFVFNVMLYGLLISIRTLNELSSVPLLYFQYRAKNDIYNAITAGLFSGAVLARKSGPKAMAGGAVAFAAFSAAIDLFLRREPSEYVLHCLCSYTISAY